jgi:hypothetical protein
MDNVRRETSRSFGKKKQREYRKENFNSLEAIRIKILESYM